MVSVYQSTTRFERSKVQPEVLRATDAEGASGVKPDTVRQD